MLACKSKLNPIFRSFLGDSPQSMNTRLNHVSAPKDYDNDLITLIQPEKLDFQIYNKMTRVVGTYRGRRICYLRH